MGRWGSLLDDMPDAFVLAVYLDVRLKDFSFVLDENQRASLVTRAKELCQQCLEMPEDAPLSQGVLLSQELVGGGSSSSSRSSSSHEHEKRLALLFGEDLAKTTESLREESSNELEVYHDLRSIPFAVDGKVANPLDWWKTHHVEFPKLAKLARRFLCIIASSVPCERVFSKSRLTTVNRLICPTLVRTSTKPPFLLWQLICVFFCFLLHVCYVCPVLCLFLNLYDPLSG